MKIFINEKEKELYNRDVNIEVKSLEEHDFDLIFRFINKKLTDKEHKSLNYYLTKELGGQNEQVNKN